MLLRRFRLTTKSEFDYQGLFLSEEFAFIQFRDTHKVAYTSAKCQLFIISFYTSFREKHQNGYTQYRQHCVCLGSVWSNNQMAISRRPRIMFVTSEENKKALEVWASDTSRTVSSLLDELISEILIQKGLIEAPKKLLNWSDRKT